MTFRAGISDGQSATSARERVLRTAHDLFYQDGICATGIDRIIADAGVTKTTFYRHFPSKHQLVLAYLDYRHNLWMTWFREALQRHGGSPFALTPVLREWFTDARYRGCAFINGVGEMGGNDQEVVRRSRVHKDEMIAVLEQVLAPSDTANLIARQIGLVIDGVIVRVSLDGDVDAALASLEALLGMLLGRVEGLEAP